jgi:hypothetical protein
VIPARLGHKEGAVFTLIHFMSPRDVLVRQLPVMGISLVIAEVFYKFGSFTLECLAFLGTWYLADGLRNAAGRIGRSDVWRRAPR